MYDRILIPVEGEEREERMLQHAIEHAQNHNAELHDVHVMEGRIGAKRANSGDKGADGPHADKVESERILDSIESQIPDGVVLVRAQLGGDVADEILGYIDEEDIDLVVMGTHGRSGVRRMLIGSVAEEVVRHSDCPVLTVPLGD